MKKILLIIISVLLWASVGYGATIYVDGDLAGNCTGDYSIANRSCTGSDGDAYVELDDALSAIPTTDIVYIRSGTYDDTDNDGYPQQYNNTKVWDVRTYNNESVVIVANTADRLFYLDGAATDGSNFSGFTISGGGRNLATGYRAVFTIAGSDNNTISDVTFDDNVAAFSLTAGATGNILSRCLIKDNDEYSYLSTTGSNIINLSTWTNSGTITGGFLSQSAGTLTVNNSNFLSTQTAFLNGLLSVSGGNLILNNCIVPSLVKSGSAVAIREVGTGAITINNSLIQGNKTAFLTLYDGDVTVSNLVVNKFPYFNDSGYGEAIFTFYLIDSNPANSTDLNNYVLWATNNDISITYFPDDVDHLSSSAETNIQNAVIAGIDVGCEGTDSTRLDQDVPMSVTYTGGGANPRVVVSGTGTPQTTKHIALLTDSGTDWEADIYKTDDIKYIGGSTIDSTIVKTINDLADWGASANDGGANSYDDTYAVCLLDGTYNLVAGTVDLVLDRTGRFFYENMEQSKSDLEAIINSNESISGYNIVSYYAAQNVALDYTHSDDISTAIKGAGFEIALTEQESDIPLSTITSVYNIQNSFTNIDRIKGAGYAALSDTDKEDRIRSFVRVWATYAFRYGLWTSFQMPQTSTDMGSDMFGWMVDEFKTLGVKVLSFKEAHDYFAGGNGYVVTDDGYTKSFTQSYDGTLQSSSPCIKAGTEADVAGLTGEQTDIFGNTAIFEDRYNLNIGADLEKYGLVSPHIIGGKILGGKFVD